MTVPELLQTAFGWICGQDPEHTWMPGGQALPFCQRCTGLYCGALTSALLHLLLRPAATKRWLKVHGSFLLIMVPFGFHWLPQEEVMRTATGVLFGFGLVGFMTLSFDEHGATRLYPNSGHTVADYGFGLIAILVFIPWAASQGGATGAALLTWIGIAGAGVLVALATVACCSMLRKLARRIVMQAHRHTA